ncbi:MAG: MFS transporter [Negativicutes bacterium]|nr:MFS transporter [Negativicutes bacterium]
MDREQFWAQRWNALFWVAMLGFILSCNYTNHGPLVPTLIKVLSITMTMAGFFTTAVFLTHGLLQMPGGAMADKLGSKNVATIGMAIIAVGNIMTGMASSYEAILLWKFFTGIGTGSAIVAGLRYVPTFFAGKEIALGQGVYGGSILLGSGFVIYVIPQLLAFLGWQGVFYTTGAMAGVFTILWHFFAPKTPVSGVVNKIDWAGLTTNRNIWLLSAAQFGSFGTVISCGVWVNTLLQKSVHLDPKTAGMIGSIVLLIGIIMRPLGGWILDQKLLTPKQLLVLAHAGLAVGFAWIGLVETTGMAIIAIFFTGCMASLPFGGIFHYAVVSFPKNPGVAMGFVNTWGAIAVMTLPPMMGKLVDTSGTFLTAFYLLAGVAAFASICSAGIVNIAKE